VRGFDVDRLYLSAPGGGWLVMDTLDMHGGLGGAMSLTAGYARDPLRVRAAGGAGSLSVVSDLSMADFGFAATYDRFRLYLGFDAVVDVSGMSGIVGCYRFAAPATGTPLTPSGVDPSTAPDTFGDAQVGFDARFAGSERSRLRLGAGVQVWIPSPNSNRGEYVTDETLRAMLRLLFAGDVGPLAYAGQVGVHVRSLDDTPSPGSPEGSELLFGVATGLKLAVARSAALVVGPEVFGETALRDLGGGATGVEALVTGRLEGTAEEGAQVRIKLGAGGGLDARFGAAALRVVVGVEVFGRQGSAKRTRSAR
jgi:hypothetical protein